MEAASIKTSSLRRPRWIARTTSGRRWAVMCSLLRDAWMLCSPHATIIHRPLDRDQRPPHIPTAPWLLLRVFRGALPGEHRLHGKQPALARALHHTQQCLHAGHFFELLGDKPLEDSLGGVIGLVNCQIH